jgi:hypothetical protein
MKMATSRCRATRTLLSLGIAAGMLLVMPGCFLLFRNFNTPWYIEKYGDLPVERRVQLFKEYAASRKCERAPCHHCGCMDSDESDCAFERECSGIIASLGSKRPYETALGARERLSGVVTLFAFINASSSHVTSRHRYRLLQDCISAVACGSDEIAAKIEAVTEMMGMTNDPQLRSLAGDAIANWESIERSTASPREPSSQLRCRDSP